MPTTPTDPTVPALVLADAERGEQHEPAERDRDHQLPAEVHQLVVAQPGQRGPEPHVDVEEHEQLEQEPHGAGERAEERQVDRVPVEADRLRATEEQGDDHRAHRDGVHELGEVEEREADAGVLGVEPGDELLLGLDEVERRPVELGGGGDHEDDERQEPGGDHAPLAEAALGVDDAARAQRAGDQDHRRQAEAERGLVGHHLRRGAHRAEQRVLRARRPAGEHDPVDGDGRQRQQQQHTDRRVGQLQPGDVAEDHDRAVLAVAEVAAERDDRPDQERRDEREVRRQLEHEPAGVVRDQVFLEEQLRAVGERLQDAERTGLVRADAVLHPGDDLALEPDHQHRADEADDEDHQDLEQHDEDVAERQVTEQQWVECDHRVSILTSTTGAVQSMRSPIGRAGLVERHPGRAADHVGVGLDGEHDRGPAARHLDRGAVHRVEPVEVERVQVDGAAVGERGHRR